MGHITISKLQSYIKEQDYNPELKQSYFLKLAEEVGELSRAMRKNATPATELALKGTIEEEIYDVIYYVIAIANCYDIEIEKWIYIKEKLNDEKYQKNHAAFYLVTSPQSAPFYEKKGAVAIELVESSITLGRMIPRLKYIV